MMKRESWESLEGSTILVVLLPWTLITAWGMGGIIQEIINEIINKVLLLSFIIIINIIDNNNTLITA